MAVSKGKCAGILPVVEATTPEARFEVTKTFVENIDPVAFRVIAVRLSRNSSNPLRTAYSTLVERYGRRETETGFRGFVSAIDEISIAQAQACSGPSPLRVSDTAKLVREYNAASAAKNAPLQRSTIGKLLCVDSSVTTSPTPVPIRGRRSSMDCPLPGPCTCPPGGITGELFCPCQFFKCLDPGDVFEPILGFNTDLECLAFAVDTTGSMDEEIDAAREIVLNFLRSEEEIGDVGCYLLIPFNDVGPNDAIVAEESKN